MSREGKVLPQGDGRLEVVLDDERPVEGPHGGARHQMDGDIQFPKRLPDADLVRAPGAAPRQDQGIALPCPQGIEGGADGLFFCHVECSFPRFWKRALRPLFSRLPAAVFAEPLEGGRKERLWGKGSKGMPPSRHGDCAAAFLRRLYYSFLRRAR